MQDPFFNTKFKKNSNFLLSVSDMYRIDKKAIEDGRSSLKLMRNAGKKVAKHSEKILKKYGLKNVLILCGPGNNGGDGYFAGHFLKQISIPVDVFSSIDTKELKGDAKEAFKIFSSNVTTKIRASEIEKYDLIIDALFGAGLSRPLNKCLVKLIENIKRKKKFVLAVDIPSGISGDTGKIIGKYCFQADHTVTFFNPKVGHKCFPGKEKCGELEVVDIGLKPKHAHKIIASIKYNSPSLWKASFPKKTWSSHKYKHGHSLIFAGEMLGATILSCLAALRVGAGLVSVVCNPNQKSVLSLIAPSIIVITDVNLDINKLFNGKIRYDSIVFGPGTLPTKKTRDTATLILSQNIPTVLDAGAITAFEKYRKALFSVLHKNVILTPHFGEFKRLFPEFSNMDNLQASFFASQNSGALCLLKGANTTISNPEGIRILSTEPEAPHLATAGSGDVLAGIISGLISQGMDLFKAASAGTWLHAHAASDFGPGLTSEDILKTLPKSISEVFYS